MAVLQVRRGRAHRVDATWVEAQRRVVPDVRDIDLHFAARRDFGALFSQLGIQRRQRVVVRMAQIHGEVRAAGNGVAGVRRHRQFPDRADRIRRVPPRHVLHRQHQLRGRGQGVAAARHRRRAGVGVAPAHLDVVPPQPLRAGDHADGVAVALQNRPLLDVRFEQRADGMRAARLVAEVVDALQLIAHAAPAGIDARPSELLVEQAGEHARGQHRRRETAALFIGPHHNLQRRLGFLPAVIQRAHHFQRRQYAVDAVELAAMRLGVEVAAGQHRRKLRRAALAPGENVAHVVDRDSAVGFAAP